MTNGNRNYEIMFIVRPDVDETELDKLVETFSGYVTGGGGEVKSTEKMGRRRLAYTVQKFNDGFYILMIVSSPASLISEIERRLRVSEPVIKFLTVRMDEEEKRLAKIKKHRDAHVKRSALPAVNAEAQAPEPTPAPTAVPPQGDVTAPAAVAAIKTDVEAEAKAEAQAEAQAEPETVQA